MATKKIEELIWVLEVLGGEYYADIYETRALARLDAGDWLKRGFKTRLSRYVRLVT